MDVLFENATIVVGLAADSKRQALQGLADQVAADCGLDARIVMEHLLERERLGATGVGGGVAMPHGRIAGLDRLAVGFAKLAEPVEYESPDGEPVDLLLLLLAPEDAGAVCLKALSKASRVLRSASVRSRLRGARDPEAVRAILLGDKESAAA